METTTELLNAYRADPLGVRMKLERAARRARAEAMSQLPAKAAGFIASGCGRLAAGWVTLYARPIKAVAK
jgi:hypothetical protein